MSSETDDRWFVKLVTLPRRLVVGRAWYWQVVAEVLAPTWLYLLLVATMTPFALIAAWWFS
jgi:hypothetical protein